MKKALFALIALSIFIPKAHALNTQSLRYYFPGGRALSQVESMPKPKDTITFGFGFNYANKPLEFGTTATGGRVSGIVDHLFTFDLMTSYSFTDRIAIGIDVPLHVSNHVIALTTTTMETKFNIGDILLSGLINIIDPETNNINAGLGVAPFISLPTGRSSDFVGDSSVTGGLLVVGDIDLDGHYIGINLGVRARKTENFLNLSVASEFMYNLAYHHLLVKSARLDGFAEINGSTVFKNFWQKANASPFEARLGLTKTLLPDDQLKITGAGGIGIGSGFGAPDFRVVLKVTYDLLVTRTERPKRVSSLPQRIQRIERELKELTIYYPTDSSKVDPFYDQKIASIAQILRENPDLGPLYIIGHTDDVGSNKYNQRLSERRAKKAASSIISHGMDPLNIVWVGLGEEYPIVENSSDANRSLNRRTLFTFIKPTQLTEHHTPKGKVVGINVVTGKKNDSYTEVLKELERKQHTGSKTRVIKRYKDKSEVIAEDEETLEIKRTPTSEPKKYKIKRRSKKFYETETTKGGTIIIKEKEIYEEY